jgi:hypothetical protein
MIGILLATVGTNRGISGHEMILQARSELNRVFYLVDPVWYCTLYRCMHLGGRCTMCCCIGKANLMRCTLYRLHSRRTPAKTISATKFITMECLSQGDANQT